LTRRNYKIIAARPAAAMAPKPASYFMAALALTWIGPLVVAVGPVGVLVAAKVVGATETGTTGMVTIGMVTVPGVGTTRVDEPMTMVVGDGQ